VTDCNNARWKPEINNQLGLKDFFRQTTHHRSRSVESVHFLEMILVFSFFLAVALLSLLSAPYTVYTLPLLKFTLDADLFGCTR